MTLTPDRDDEAQRIWTRHITDNVLVGEYDDGDIIIANCGNAQSWQSLLLEQHQMSKLMEFSYADDRETIGQRSLGKDSLGDEATVKYQDDTYIIVQDVGSEVQLPTKQVNQLVKLLEPPRGKL